MTHMSPFDLRAIADEIRRAQDDDLQIPPFTSRFPGLDLPAAYEVARLVHEARVARGERVVGRKIGFTNAALWPIYGVYEPIWGYVYDTTLVGMGEPRAGLSLKGLADPKIEPEVVVHFRSTPRPQASSRELLAAIDWVACGFEVVQSHFPGWKFKAADTVTDNGLHGRLAVSAPLELPALGRDPFGALGGLQLQLSCDARWIETGAGSNALGNPIDALARLVQVLASQPGHPPIQAGEVVTTGTLTLAHPIVAGETWRADAERVPLPSLTLQVSG